MMNKKELNLVAVKKYQKTDKYQRSRPKRISYYKKNRLKILAKAKIYKKTDKYKRRIASKEFKEKRKSYTVKGRYGITLLEYNKLKEKQNGGCAICKLNKRLGLDHNHKTGQNRELLCINCNFMLGSAKDSVE